MNKIRLSGSTLNISPIVLGMWHVNTIEQNQFEKLVESGLESGITTFDHADIYGGYTCEGIFGKWFKNSSVKREDIQLVSKCGIKLISENRPDHTAKQYDTSKAHIIDSVNRSLKSLNTDYLDLLLIHRPNPLIKPREVGEAFDELKVAGKVKHFGVSNFTPSQFSYIKNDCGVPLITNQIEISAFASEVMFDGTLDYFQKHKLSLMAWSPLGGGTHIKSIVENELVKTLAKKYELSIGDLLLCWLQNHPAPIVPVIGTMNPDRVKSATKTLGIAMDSADWFQLLEITRGREIA
ncbi:aldo/keto reductase [Fulvivirga lutimaris]|uniref:aldo/keto reductase n=1 Tax=Fulvivirga lutimaris TaxID=1819566 RepID=UPI0012BBB3E4|nr:aldo/keto reductase [Fulvivirga lutimaris]MTI39625.1 oxidoreductase [Fulvivirga lutimaris]